jgi:hypothetical protein
LDQPEAPGNSGKAVSFESFLRFLRINGELHRARVIDTLPARAIHERSERHIR